MGPATVNNTKNGKLKMHFMTMIDPVSCWFKIAPIGNDPKSYKCNRIFDEVWLSRYQRPQLVGSDGGSKFKLNFNQLCTNCHWSMEFPGQCNFGTHSPSTRQLFANLDLDEAVFG